MAAPSSHHAKSLRKRLQRQLEFYLSASNVRQDKFLQQHMDDAGFVPAALFLSFNKIKMLRATEKLLLEAASKSDALRVDETHAAIAPSHEALQAAVLDEGRAAADAHTIYVEGYDVDTHDHDSLRKIFAVFGKVTLVSMPRFSPSRKFKGFAFVEFATDDAAKQALEATLAAAKDERSLLCGLRAMGKRQWLEMKEKLKAQLLVGSGGSGGSGSRDGDGSASGNATNARTIEATTSTEVTTQRTTRRHSAAKKKTVSGHVRFRDDDDEEEDDHDQEDNVRPDNVKRPRTTSD